MVQPSVVDAFSGWGQWVMSSVVGGQWLMCSGWGQWVTVGDAFSGQWSVVDVQWLVPSAFSG